jgi:hypothetical protein
MIHARLAAIQESREALQLRELSLATENRDWNNILMLDRSVPKSPTKQRIEKMQRAVAEKVEARHDKNIRKVTGDPVAARILKDLLFGDDAK